MSSKDIFFSLKSSHSSLLQKLNSMNKTHTSPFSHSPPHYLALSFLKYSTGCRILAEISSPGCCGKTTQTTSGKDPKSWIHSDLPYGPCIKHEVDKKAKGWSRSRALVDAVRRGVTTETWAWACEPSQAGNSRASVLLKPHWEGMIPWGRSVLALPFGTHGYLGVASDRIVQGGSE